jgi:hypothetical protein
MVIARNIPRKPDGKDFGPLWFSDTRLFVMKTEKNGLTIDRDSLKITDNFPTALNTYNISISDHSIKTSSAAADYGLANEKQLSSTAAVKNAEKCTVFNYNNIVGTLQKHSEQLRMIDPLLSEHCEKLNLCIQLLVLKGKTQSLMKKSNNQAV